MAYFDNAATTYPKPECVYRAMDEFYRRFGGNAGRGNYALSQSAASLIAETRVRIQNLLHCPAKNVIFTPSATIALNMVLQGLLRNSLSVHTVYISPFEHNAVTRVLHFLKQVSNIEIKTLTVDSALKYDLERIRYQFDGCKPDMVIISHASNVTGQIAPVKEIFTLAKAYKAMTVLDMAQTAGLVDINIGSELYDFAVFAGHKTLYGPTGLSGFVMNPMVDLPPVLFGGTGFDSANQDMPASIPERYEMGTLNISGVAGLHAALGWIQEIGIDNLWKVESNHRSRLLRLLKNYDFIRIIDCDEDELHAGIVSGLVDGISSDSAGGVFAERGIAVRTGLQCAPLAHQTLGTFPSGTIRFSTGYFTTDDDFSELESALDDIEENL